MKLFGRSSGYYLFWTGFVYFWVGTYLAFTHVARPEFATLGFVLALSVPLWCPPVARYFNMEPVMFDWFKKKDGKVVQFPKQESGYVDPTPAPKEEPAKIFYRMGLTDNNRVAFSMDYTEVTMNREGCQQLIDQIKFFQSQLRDEEELGA